MATSEDINLAVDNSRLRWLNSFSAGPVFPGICQMFKVRLLQERGIWADAEAEALRLSEELRTRHVSTAARGCYEAGEIKRLRGDLDAAEKLFKQAHQLGFDPQPGLSLLRLAQGKPDSAAALLQSALDATTGRLDRARLLPALLEIALARRDLDSAARAAKELESIAADYLGPRLRAAACSARGAIHLAHGEGEQALVKLREAVRLGRRSTVRTRRRSQGCVPEKHIDRSGTKMVHGWS